MAYSVIQQKAVAVASSNQASVASGAFSSSVTATNQLLVIVQYQRGSQRTVSFARGADSFTEIGAFWDSGSEWGMVAAIVQSAAAGTTQITATFSGDADFPAIYAVEISGLGTFVSGERAWQIQNAPGTGTDALSSTNVTPSTQPALLFGLCSNVSGSGSAPTAGTGFTGLTATWNYGGGALATPEHKRLTSTSAVPALWTAVSGDKRYSTIGIVVPEGGASPQSITPSGIASEEAFGTTVVAPGAVSIAPSGIASEEAFGTPALTGVIAPTGIASEEAFGTAVLTTGAVSVAPSGIVSAEVFGDATVAVGAINISPAGIASEEAFGTAAISVEGSEIQPSSIGSAEAFGTAAITSVVTISPTGIPSAEVFGTTRIGLYTIDGSLDSTIDEAYGSLAIYSDGDGNFFTIPS